MISTVTISTVSTVTTVAAIGLGVIASGVGSATLVGFLAAKEFASPKSNGRLQRVSRCLMIGIIPLSIAFTATVLLRVADILK